MQQLTKFQNGTFFGLVVQFWGKPSPEQSAILGLGGILLAIGG